MKRYKLVKDCNDGDWVFYECGKLGMLKYNKKYDYWNHSDGYMCYGCNKDSKVYPLTIHNKVIADEIQKYYNRFFDYKLINGSYWINWLDDIYHQVMELDDNAKSEEYRKYWYLIDNKINELLKAKEEIDKIKIQYKI